MKTIMKSTYIILALLLLFHLPVSAQDDERDVNSSITEVTVFLRGAQVNRDSKARLQKGKNVLVFRGLAAGIDPKSIQVSAPENVLINSVTHEINFLEKQKDNPRLTKVSDSLETVRDLMEVKKNERTVLDIEKKMVLANQKLGSEKSGVTMEELLKAANFFRQRLTEIENKLLTISDEERELKRSQNRLKRQFVELNGQRNRPSNDIRVILQTFTEETVPVSIRYLVAEASWTPGYDLRATNTESPIRLDYRADVYQNTGVDWNNVQLTLSSGNPNQGGTQPSLNPWNLYVQAPYDYKWESKARGQRAAPAPAVSRDEAESESEEEDGWGDDGDAYEADFETSETLADYTTVSEGATTAEFAISIKQSVSSGGKPQQVSIQSSELPAYYQHFAVPKLDKDAFLLARVTDWESLNLLPGAVQIFFEGTYVTESYIDPNFTRDTLDFSLGRDKKVVIERERLKDFSKVKTIGFNRQKTFAYEIKVRNTKAEAVNIVLEDQIPISMDKDITVKVEEVSGGKLNEETGKLTWDLKLAAGESKSMKLIFSVKHPKNKSVPGI
jgi:uncharacterized protein (TIGR02231 family)